MSRTSRNGCRGNRAASARVNDAKDHRDQKQRRGGSENQAADHGAAERCILFAAFAHREGHRRHADDHRKSRHEHRAKTGKAGFEGRLERVAVNGQAFAAETDHEDGVGGRHPHAHDRSRQRGHGQRGMGREQHPDDAGKRRGQRRDDHERIGPRLEVDHDDQVDQHDCAEQAEQHASERAVHGLHLAEQRNRRTLGQRTGITLHHALDIGCDRAEIAILRGREDLDHRLDVVLAHDRIGVRTLDGREAAQNLAATLQTRGDWQILQRGKRIQVVLRRLHHDRIRHAVHVIQPERGRDLTRPREVHDQAVGHVSLVDAEQLRARAVDVDVKRWRVLRLLDTGIDYTGNLANLAQQPVRVSEVPGQVVAANLQVNGGQRAEVQDLADDVRRWERERHARIKTWQLLAHLAHVLRGRTMIFVQRDLDVAVLRADRPGVVIGEIDTADRQADVVNHGGEFSGRNDLTDRSFHVRENLCGLLDPHADRRAHVQQDLPGIHVREKVAAEQRHQRERDQDETEEATDEGRAMVECEFKQAVIAGANFLEASFEALLEASKWARALLFVRIFIEIVGMQQVLRHRGNERSRQDERRDHREDHGLGHWHEEEPRDAVEEEHWYEHNANTDQGHERRRDDLRGAIKDGLFYLLALLQMPVDIFDGDSRVVDENPHRERKAAERHDVERLTERRQGRYRGEDGEWNRGRNDDGRTPAAEEQQDHEAGQRGRYQALTRHAADGRAHEQRLVTDRRNLQRVGQ